MSGQAAVQFQAPARADRTVPAPLTEANLNAHAAQLAAANSSASRTGGDGDARVADHDAVAHATAAAQTHGTLPFHYSINAWLSSTEDPYAGLLRGSGK